LETKGDYSTKHKVKLNLMNTESGAALQNCRVTFNNGTITTNENGEAIFNVTAGFYSGMAEKRHFNTTSFGDFSVYSDTTFTIALDSAEVIYDVNIHISDEATGESLSAVNVTLGDKDQTTGVEGALAFKLNPGSYAVDINKTKYSPVQTDFLVQSDTTFLIALTRSHANIKFRIKEGSTPVNDALVIFNGDTLYTSALGFCTFRTVGINKAYSYSVEHEFFKTYEDRVEVSDDTTLNLQLEKTVANIEFQLAAEGETIENPIVVINDDTTRFDENMKARLYNLPIDATYEYRILSGNFATHPGSVWLQNDTVVNIVVVYTSMLENSKPVIKVYPNPAKKILRVSSKDVVAEVKIFDAAGRLRLQKTLESMQAEIDVSALNQGLYLISFLSGDRKEIKTRQFIIQR
ncbi:MAG TPA: T9SS type A sorting domain-containing protein, partial [Prolixibacteraceae bacterium]|nr:T9SS type A sorting domain-containing protein [Prolixibacteraceae bacterium]